MYSYNCSFVTVDTAGNIMFFTPEGCGWKLMSLRTVNATVECCTANDSYIVVTTSRKSLIIVDIVLGVEYSIPIEVEHVINMALFKLEGSDVVGLIGSSSKTVLYDIKKRQLMREYQQKTNDCFAGCFCNLKGDTPLVLHAYSYFSYDCVCFNTLPKFERNEVIQKRGEKAAGIFDLSGFYGDLPCSAVFESSGHVYIVVFDTT